MGVTNVIKQEQNVQEIPSQGPVLIIANHPLGGLEGIALAYEILKVRPDLRVLTNELLRLIPELPNFLGVDVLSKMLLEPMSEVLSKTSTRKLIVPS